MAVDDFCYLTTRGRRTGRPHRIEIWYAREGEVLYLLSGGGGRSDWVRNLLAEPSVQVEIDGVIHDARARVIDGDDEEGRARTLVFDKYQARTSDDLSNWRQRATSIAIDLAPSP